MVFKNKIAYRYQELINGFFKINFKLKNENYLQKFLNFN